MHNYKEISIHRTYHKSARIDCIILWNSHLVILPCYSLTYSVTQNADAVMMSCGKIASEELSTQYLVCY